MYETRWWFFFTFTALTDSNGHDHVRKHAPRAVSPSVSFSVLLLCNFFTPSGRAYGCAGLSLCLVYKLLSPIGVPTRHTRQRAQNPQTPTS